ncbi:MAG: glycosyltransferase family 2 protein [Fimbriimonadaceae bacterium]
MPGCLDSVAWCDDVHVFDSCSTDRTVDIARERGATVTQRPFDNWASHQNWGLQNLPFRHPWVLYIDADERVTPELAEAVRRAAEQPGDRVAFEIRRRDFLHGRWLKHVQATPYYLRLFRPDKMRYERLVNPVSVPNGPVGHLAGYLDHYPFSRGMSHWFERHNWYSTLEATQEIVDREHRVRVSLVRALFARDLHERRYHQKGIFHRLPARPTLRFLILYVLKGGFLDGRAGLTYARLQAIYEYMIVLKVREMLRERR